MVKRIGYGDIKPTIVSYLSMARVVVLVSVVIRLMFFSNICPLGELDKYSFSDE